MTFVYKLPLVEPLLYSDRVTNDAQIELHINNVRNFNRIYSKNPSKHDVFYPCLNNRNINGEYVLFSESNKKVRPSFGFLSGRNAKSFCVTIIEFISFNNISGVSIAERISNWIIRTGIRSLVNSEKRLTVGNCRFNRTHNSLIDYAIRRSSNYVGGWHLWVAKYCWAIQQSEWRKLLSGCWFPAKSLIINYRGGLRIGR